MVNINENLGSTAPNAYVKSIRLSRGPSIQTNADTALLNQQRVSEVTSYDGTLEYSYSPDSIPATKIGSTSVALSVVVKDVINAFTKRASWLSSPKSQGNFLVKAILVLNQDLEEKILQQNILDKLPIEMPRGFTKFIDWQEQSISLNNNDGGKYTVEKNKSTGNQIASKEYKFVFNLPQEDPSHLTCFIFCQFNPTNELNTNTNVHSMINIERIIQNSSTVAGANIYTTLQGELWGGPIHMHQGRPMEGALHSSTPHNYLNVRNIFNFKLQDLRVFDKIDQLKIDIKPDNTQFEKNYISNLYLSRNSDGAATFIFNYDHLGLLTNASQFGKLYVNASSGLRKKLLKMSPIVEMAILRDRVRTVVGVNSLLSADILKYDFDREDLPEVIVTSGDQGGEFVNSIRYTLPGEYTNVYKQVNENQEPPSSYVSHGSIKEIAVDRIGTIRTFSGTDVDVLRRTDGLYQYEVRIQLQDGALSFMRQKLNELRIAIHSMEQYVNIAKQVGHYDARRNAFTKQFIDFYGSNTSDFVRPWMGAIPLFLDVLDLLTDMTVGQKNQFGRELYACLDPAVSNLTINGRFIKQMNYLRKKLESLIGENRNLHTRDKSAIHQGAIPSDSLFIQSTFPEIFNSNIPKGVGFNYFCGAARDQTLTIDGPALTTRVQEEVDRYTIDPYTADELIQTFDFITNAEANALAENNSKMYLAPAEFTVAGTTINLLSPNKDSLDYLSVTGVIQSILNTPNSKGATTQPKSDITQVLTYMGQGTSKERLEKIKDLYVNVALNSDIMVNSLNVDFTNNLSPTVSSEEFLGKGNKFSNNTDATPSTTKKKEKENFSDAISVIRDVLSINNINFHTDIKFSATPVSNVSFDLNKNNNFINKRVRPMVERCAEQAEPRAADILGALPNQIKKLTLNKENIYKGDGANLSSDEDSKNDGFMYNFGMLRAVEYLNGYEGGFIKSPNWSPVTEGVLNSMRGALICRIRQFNDPNTNIGAFEAINQIPVNNEYFILTSRGGDSGPQAVAGSSTPIINIAGGVGYTRESFVKSMGTDLMTQLFNFDEQKLSIEEQIELTSTQLPGAPTSFSGKISGLSKK